MRKLAARPTRLRVKIIVRKSPLTSDFAMVIISKDKTRSVIMAPLIRALSDLFSFFVCLSLLKTLSTILWAPS